MADRGIMGLRILTVAGLFLLTSGLAPARNVTAGANDMQFAASAAIDNIGQIRAGKLATENAYSAKVREFGKRMVDDHTKLEDQLKTITDKKRLNIPSTLDANGITAFGKLHGLSGEAFDREYILEMVVEHEKAVTAFQNEALYGRNKDLSTWATASLPTIQDHLRLAREIQSEQQSGTTGALSRK